MSPDASDEELMVQYGRGDETAFEILYRRHKDGFYRFLLRQAGSEHRAQEIFQETWMKVIGARQRYRVKARFKTWLYRIAMNTLVDEYRQTSRMGEVALSSQGVDTPDESASAETGYAAERLRRRLYSALDELPLEQRTAFLLKQDAGMDIALIAEICDTSQETVKSRLRYAVSRLRKQLHSENDQ